MKSLRIPIVMSVILLSFGLLAISLVVASQAIAAPFKQSDIDRDRPIDQNNDHPNISLVPEDSGGPDAFGYTYIDSNEAGGTVYNFVEISGTNNVPLGDETKHGPFSLGFTFNYYGIDYTDIWMGSNGWLTVGATDPGATDLSNDCPLPSTLGNENLIAGIWDDLDQNTAVPNGTGWYQSYAASTCPYGGYGGACFIAEWKGMYHFVSDPPDDLTFEIILFDDDNILIQIADASDELGLSSTTGLENADGTDGLTYGGCNIFGHISDNLAILFEYPPPILNPEFSNSSKFAPGATTADSTFTYTITMENIGIVTATNTVMTDLIPVGATYVPGSATNGATYNAGLNQIEWTGEVGAETSVSVSFMVTATASSGSITNTAVITHPEALATVSVTATTSIVSSAAYPICVDFETGALPNFMFADTTSSGGANGRVQVTNAFPHTGVYAVDLDTDCDNCGGVTQQAAVMLVDLAGQSNVALSFWVFEHFDESNPEDGVFISDDGGANWALIQSLNNFPTNYEQVILDLDAAVANAGMSYVDGFMIRFQSLDGATIPGFDGYSFDDICVGPAVPDIDVDPPDLSSTQLADQIVNRNLSINNLGASPLTWNITQAATDCATPTAIPWANAVPSNGTTAAGSSSAVAVGFDSAGLAPAVYTSLLCVNSDDPDTTVVSVPLTLTVAASPAMIVSPSTLASTQTIGTQIVRTLTISNIGTADLEWEIIEEAPTTQAKPPQPITSVLAMGIAETANGYVASDASLANRGNGPTIASHFTNSPPTLDGVLSAGEWSGAFMMDISIAAQPVNMYIMHDANTLYLAFDDQNDTTVDGFDQIGIYIDDEGGTPPILWDNMWTNGTCSAGVNTGEGNYWFGNFAPSADDQWREWIAGPTACPEQFGGTNGQIAYGVASGTMVYEAAIPLDGTSALTANLNEEFGFRVYTADNAGGLGIFTGRFPAASVFDDPSTYGNLQLAACEVNDISWLMTMPTSGTTAAGNASAVDVVFDSNGLTEGTYTGSLCVNSNDPLNSLVTVPLTMTVAQGGFIYLPTVIIDASAQGKMVTDADVVARNDGWAFATLAALPIMLGMLVPYRRYHGRFDN